MVCLGVLGTATAFVLYFTLIAEAGAGRAALCGYLIPPLALAYGALFLDETITWAAIGGPRLILVGVSMAGRRARASRQRAARRGRAPLVPRIRSWSTPTAISTPARSRSPSWSRNAREAGVERMLAIGMDSGSCRHALSAADDFDEVFVSVGPPPARVRGLRRRGRATSSSCSSSIRRCAPSARPGSTTSATTRPATTSAASFIAQMELAREARIPLVVHTREAADDTLELLATHADGVEVIIHCFSLSDHVDECIERGYYCSFAGNVTYPKATDLQEAAARVPDELILAETDAPFLSPQERRSKPNQPAFVTATAGFLAELRGTPLHAMESILDGNAARLFRW